MNAPYHPLYLAHQPEAGVLLVEPIDPIVSDARQFNGQWVYGPVLSELFGCDCVVESVTRTSTGTLYINFNLPTDVNYACCVTLSLCGVKDGRIQCQMSVDDLRQEVDHFDDQKAKGLF